MTLHKVKSFFWLTLLNQSIRVDRKPFLRSMSHYFTYKEREAQHSITDVKCFETRDNYTVRITTYRPGLLIGKAGSFIDGLTDWMNDREFSKPVIIDLKECKMWFKLYS